MKTVALALLFCLAGCQAPCQDRVQQADTLTKAADICASQSIGCNLTHQDIVRVIKAQKEAQACLVAGKP